MNTIRYKPQAIVTFFTETGELVARGTNDPQSKMDDDVISITTHRDMGADAPTFSIDLVFRKPWHKWIAANDLVTIVMQRPPEDQKVVFIGLVDDVRKTLAMSEEGVSRVVRVTGRGVVKSFLQFDIGVVPEAGQNALNAHTGWLLNPRAGVNIKGFTTSSVINAAWDNLGKKFMDYNFSNGKSLFSIIDKTLTDRTGCVLIDASCVVNFQGSLWAFFKEIAESPFYEIYWEIINGAPTMIVRPTPFNPEQWNALPRIEITDEDVISESLGRSDVETYTIFSLGAKTLWNSKGNTLNTFGCFPYYYEPYSKKYGIRRLHITTKYIPLATEVDTKDNIASKLTSMMADLYNWNVKNNSMYNGTMLLRGSNKYQVGQVIAYPSIEDNSNLEYYIKAVSQRFINFGTYTTEVNVIRGIDPSIRFTSPWGKYAEFKGIGWEPFNMGDSGAYGDYAGMRYSDNPAPIDQEKANAVVQYAMELYNGRLVKYVFGGNKTDSPIYEVDCAGFTKMVYGKIAGVELPQTADYQVKGQYCWIIPKEKLLPGDLVFFQNTYCPGVSHVGIYVGNNQFVHARNSDMDLCLDTLNDYWGNEKWFGGGRVLGKYQGKVLDMLATAYGANPMNGGSGCNKTATGTDPVQGRTIAVDPDVIPLGSTVKIDCAYPGISGTYTAEDTGGAIKGNRIDIYFNDLTVDPVKAKATMEAFGKKYVTVTILS